jgi:hypothetical protein
MRWITLATYLMMLLLSLGAGILLAYHTKSILPLGIPSPFLVAMRPILRFLFGEKHR